MPSIQTADIQTYYEIHGRGAPLVFIHGGWVSRRMWQPQVEHFCHNYQVITYDIRGHGQTGGSPRRRYSVELFADDLSLLLKALGVEKPAVCGLSLGGMVAQAYANRHPDNLSALVLADTAVSSALTLSDKLTAYVLAPKWLFMGLVRLLGIERYTRFAFWYAARSRSKEWVGLDASVIQYEKEEMLRFDTDEFNKIFAAMYDFRLQPLADIEAKTLVINGQYESRAVLRHTEKILELVPDAAAVTIPDAGHTSSLENPAAFNGVLEAFLHEVGL